MKPQDFVDTYLPHALRSQDKTGISATFTLAQAALESAWGQAAPGNMFFGVKDSDGVNGNEQLLVTTEYSRRNDLKFPEIISITPVVRGGVKMFKYKVRDYFKKYDSAEECFTDHGNFFARNPRYAAAMKVRHDPRMFAQKIAAAGYATDPNYATSLIAMIDSIEKRIKK